MNSISSTFGNFFSRFTFLFSSEDKEAASAFLNAALEGAQTEVSQLTFALDAANSEKQRIFALLKIKDALLAASKGKINELQVEKQYSITEVENSKATIVSMEKQLVSHVNLLVECVQTKATDESRISELEEENASLKVQVKRGADALEEANRPAPKVKRVRRTQIEIEAEAEANYRELNKRDPPAGMETNREFFAKAFECPGGEEEEDQVVLGVQVVDQAELDFGAEFVFADFNFAFNEDEFPIAF
jgi:hypothetical protein